MRVELELRPASGRVHAVGPRAWLVPGADPARWLCEAVRLFPNPEDLRFAVLPTSRAAPAPIGAVLFDARVASSVAPTAVAVSRGRAVPYVVRAGAVLHPLDGELWPAVRDEELHRLAGGRLLVFHPRTGLVTFEPGELLRAVDLVVAREAVVRWTDARVGLAPPPVIRGLVGARPPRSGDIFAEEADDIGADPLPDPARGRRPDKRRPEGRAADETPSADAVNGKGGWRGWIGRVVLGVTRWAPGTADQPTWINRLEDWAMRWAPAPRGDGGGTGRGKARRRRIDERRRQREIERLLALLKDRPGEGLRRALPLTGNGCSGPDLGGDQLLPRRTDFSLTELGRGGAGGGAWAVDSKTYRDLVFTYRELARAEVDAGRHRRAAYIHAHLLGDLLMAARVLEQGGFYREAAVVYRDHLEDGAAAVRCLREGGLLAEAVKLAEELELWLEAGDMHAALGDEERSASCLRKAHAAMNAEGRWEDAARFRADRLGEVEHALDDLQSMFDQGAVEALVAWVDLTVDDGRAAAAESAVRQWNVPVGNATRERFARSLASSWQRHDGVTGLRRAIQLRLRRSLAEALAGRDAKEVAAVRASLTKTAGDDRVLRRDAALVAPLSGVGAASVDPGSMQLQWVSSDAIERADGGHEVDYAIDGDSLYAAVRLAGKEASRVDVVHTEAGAVLRSISVPGHVYEVHPLRGQGGFGVVTLAGGVREWRVMSRDPLRLPESMRALAVDDGSRVWVVSNDGDVLLADTYGPDGALRSSQPILSGEGTADLLEREAHLEVVGGRLVFAVGKLVAVLNGGGPDVFLRLPASAWGVVRSEEPSQSAVAIRMQHGFAVFDVANPEGSFEVPPVEMQRPTLGWTRSGVLVAADSQSVWMGAFVGGRLAARRSEPFSAGRPFWILPTERASEVLFLGGNKLVRYRVPATP